MLTLLLELSRPGNERFLTLIDGSITNDVLASTESFARFLATKNEDTAMSNLVTFALSFFGQTTFGEDGLWRVTDEHGLDTYLTPTTMAAARPAGDVRGAYRLFAIN